MNTCKKARTTSDIGSLPDGKAYYEYLVRQQTTTDKTREEIYDIGLSEVKRIRGIIDSVRNELGFKDDLSAFFEYEYMRNDKKFIPYKTPDEVLAAFHKIHGCPGG